MTSRGHLIEMIAQQDTALTDTEERLKTHLGNHPEEWAFGSTTDLARKHGVHRSTIVRFATKLGYHGFPELQADVRTYVLQPINLSPAAVFDDWPSEDVDVVKRIYEREVRNLGETYGALAVDVLRETSRSLATARRVVVYGRRFSFAIALHLQTALSVLRDGSVVAPGFGGSSVDALFDLGADDFVLVVSLRRHSPTVQRALIFLRERKIPHALLTDVSMTRSEAAATRVLQAHVGSTSLMESHTSLTSVGHALLTLVERELPDAPARKEAVERAWRDLT